MMRGEIKVIERLNIDINIPQEYLSFVKELQDVGIKAYFVGGCVRDALLNLHYHDFDIFCLCSKECFKTKNTKYEEVVDFERVLIVHDEKFKYYTMSFADTFEEDFQSRDLTMNSIYYDWENKKVFGIEQSFLDLDNRILRPCDNEVFIKDDLKKLRAIRLEHKIGIDAAIYTEPYFVMEDINFESIDTQFKAFRLRNEFYKHRIYVLAHHELIHKIVKKLGEFDIVV